MGLPVFAIDGKLVDEWKCVLTSAGCDVQLSSEHREKDPPCTSQDGSHSYRYFEIEKDNVKVGCFAIEPGRASKGEVESGIQLVMTVSPNVESRKLFDFINGILLTAGAHRLK